METLNTYFSYTTYLTNDDLVISQYFIFLHVFYELLGFRLGQRSGRVSPETSTGSRKRHPTRTSTDLSTNPNPPAERPAVPSCRPRSTGRKSRARSLRQSDCSVPGRSTVRRRRRRLRDTEPPGPTEPTEATPTTRTRRRTTIHTSGRTPGTRVLLSSPGTRADTPPRTSTGTIPAEQVPDPTRQIFPDTTRYPTEFLRHRTEVRRSKTAELRPRTAYHRHKTACRRRRTVLMDTPPPVNHYLLQPAVI